MAGHFLYQPSSPLTIKRKGRVEDESFYEGVPTKRCRTEQMTSELADMQIHGAHPGAMGDDAHWGLPPVEPFKTRSTSRPPTYESATTTQQLGGQELILYQPMSAPPPPSVELEGMDRLLQATANLKEALTGPCSDMGMAMGGGQLVPWTPALTPEEMAAAAAARERTISTHCHVDRNNGPETSRAAEERAAEERARTGMMARTSRSNATAGAPPQYKGKGKVGGEAMGVSGIEPPSMDAMMRTMSKESVGSRESDMDMDGMEF